MLDSDSPRAGDKTPKRISRRKLLVEGGRLSGLFACLPLLGLGSKSEAGDYWEDRLRSNQRRANGSFPAEPWSRVYKATIKDVELNKLYRYYSEFEFVSVRVRADLLTDLNAMPDIWNDMRIKSICTTIKDRGCYRLVLHYKQADIHLSPSPWINNIMIVGTYDPGPEWDPVPDIQLSSTDPCVPTPPSYQWVNHVEF